MTIIILCETGPWQAGSKPRWLRDYHAQQTELMWRVLGVGAKGEKGNIEQPRGKTERGGKGGWGDCKYLPASSEKLRERDCKWAELVS